MRKNRIVLLLLFISAAVFAGCGRVESYGQPISNRQVTKIEDIILHPDVYKDKVVTVSGRITNECSTGCWFDLKEGGAIIYVNTETQGFAIPQRSGKRTLVEGILSIENRKPKIIGKGIEIR